MKYHITGVYFSPSGGTKKALETLCGCWEGEKTFIELGAEKQDVHFSSTDLLVLALPVYSDLIPAVPGLLDGLHGEDTPCVLVAAYGNCKYGDALAQMNALLKKQGFRCAGGAAVITPHILAPTLGTDRPDSEDRKVLAEFAVEIEKKLEKTEWEQAELPGNPEPEIHRGKPLKKIRDWDICMGCGLCARVCPTGAMDKSTLLWNDDKCISCMTCVSRCPNGALGFNSSELAQRLTARFSERRPVEVFL